MKIGQFFIFVTVISLVILLVVVFDYMFKEPVEKPCKPILYAETRSDENTDFDTMLENPVESCRMPCKLKCMQLTGADCEAPLGGYLTGDVAAGEDSRFVCRCLLSSKKRNYAEDCI